jgi:hypothetical protein
MFTLLMTLACLAAEASPVQGPCDAANAAARRVVGEDPSARVGTTAPIVVRGTVELSAAAADAAAATVCDERARQLLEEQGRAVLDRFAPVWLPGFCREQVLRRWLAGTEAQAAIRVVDRERVEHDHGSLGVSYRTALTVETDLKHVTKELARLQRHVPRAAEGFAVKCGAVAGFWALLGLLISWLDRLSRGYMTWRLRLIGLFLGAAAPALALFLV